MKILISHGLPFSLAHGGTQTVINELIIEYKKLGIDVDYERWWLDEQPCDIIHSFGRPSYINIKLAKKKGIKTVMTEYLDQVSSRPSWYRFLQHVAVRSIGQLNGGGIDRLGWKVYNSVDALVYTTQYEWNMSKYIFQADPSKGYIIPHGLNAVAISKLSGLTSPGGYLISVATITERKNSLLLAQAAKKSHVPVHFIGKPYAEDEYFQDFLRLVDNKWVFYHGFVSEEEKYKLLTRASGFILLSKFESGCVAVYEAAAAGLPLLLSSLPWAKTGYPEANNISYIKLSSLSNIAISLKNFYDNSSRKPDMTFPVLSWKEVAEQYIEVYKKVI